ncbi:MAG: [protein-PII] uridylyltransferase [Deltaproteobacteria bacterium]|nr:[protein-PII] uridylyltransferase [Deltaproteobacteria bacterium]MCL5792613.1 [protein-PII] uridylyltransferase [Deltaproteobacteria bacterium]
MQNDIREQLDKLLLPLIGSITGSNRNMVTKEFISTLRGKLREAHNSGLGGYEFSVIFSDFIDGLMKALFALSNNRLPENTAVLALGGYGRSELNAYSDIDLLFLYKDMLSEAFQNSILYPLWDTKIEIGHSSRTVDECIEDAESDPTILTSLMDIRFIAGDYRLYESLHMRFLKLVRAGAYTFFTDREKEISKRREKYSNSVYTLEPNIKEGPGGLRDVHNMVWLTKLFNDITSIKDLKTIPFFDRESYEQFMSSYNLLMRIRNENHFESNVKNDRLTLDMQKHLSDFLHYENEEDILGVEKFLSDFYGVMHQIQEVVDDYIKYLRNVNFNKSGEQEIKNIGSSYIVKNDQLMFEDNHPEFYLKHPEEIISTFKILAYNNLSADIALKNAIKRALTKLEQDDELDRIYPYFLKIFAEKSSAKILRMMNNYGVLCIIIREFKTIAFRVQYDMYHIYTVGTHSIKAIEQIEKIPNDDEDPFTESIYNQIKNKQILMLAAFLHDIGKGHGKDHARKGSEIAHRIVLRLGISPTDADLVAFLVRNHLILSDTAQRRDLNDEKLIYEFSSLVKRRENLKMLYILTIADLKAVAPGVWTEWKGSLIKELFKKSEEALEQGLDMARLTTERYIRVREEVTKILLSTIDSGMIDEFLDGFRPRYFTSYSSQEIVEHFGLIVKFKMDGSLSVASMVNSQLGYTKISVCTADKPGLFATIAGVLTANGANIMDANIMVRTDGIVIDVFRVEDLDKIHPFAEYKFDKFKNDLRECLSGKSNVDILMTQRFKPSILKEKVINKLPTEIIVNEDVSDIYTLVEIYTQDRQGLLYDITSTISKLSLNIAIAKVTTRVDQVADIFYLEKINGGKTLNKKETENLVYELTHVIDKKGNAVPK